ncbi:MAG TPA: 1-deoxy-D-xylulose-5-phosphate synthase, partial [Clostridiales bacterium]|nr:1-deoxy-D-xylulose-5-phosphate synthase [Clostridiales bacterium]
MNQPFDLPLEKEQLKNMSAADLELLAVAIREELIETVSETGGHFASNLGVVELTLALEKVFDTPQDKVVWDVGHQTYVHKMLTGRWNDLKSIRQLDGLSGFPKRSESPHDLYDAGHSGTSISAALGYARARDLLGQDHACVAVIGDGSLTAGVAYEALNAAGIQKTPLIVILNDNEMSISRNVGGISRHLQNLRTSSSYLGFKNKLKHGLEAAPKLGRGLETLRDAIKYALMPAAVFEELGFKYFGPIDGHDILELIEAMETAKSLKRPVLLHVVTVKGKGYQNAEKNPGLYHGTGPFDPEIGIKTVTSAKQTYTSIFGK